MGTIECSQPASKSSWDSQDFGDISMVLKMAHFHPPGHDELIWIVWSNFADEILCMHYLKWNI